MGHLWWPHPSLMTSQWGGSQNHCWLMIAVWLWNYAASRACRRIPSSIHLPSSQMSTGPQLQDPALAFRPHSWWFCPVRHLSRFPSIWPGLGFAREVGVVFVLQNHSLKNTSHETIPLLFSYFSNLWKIPTSVSTITSLFLERWTKWDKISKNGIISTKLMFPNKKHHLLLEKELACFGS